MYHYYFLINLFCHLKHFPVVQLLYFSFNYLNHYSSDSIMHFISYRSFNLQGLFTIGLLIIIFRLIHPMDFSLIIFRFFNSNSWDYCRKIFEPIYQNFINYVDHF